ncbi:GTP pyrophosphokinase [Ruegeria arenilitoris]|uniref:GTP pyrophosphokinase n=1 Tax=Ruegeria arenilitoris TaxID=1173585 RepID=UPI001480F679|nr:RelA/SpoT domain-containing protein [Ruegeria arenilitoris]
MNNEEFSAEYTNRLSQFYKLESALRNIIPDALRDNGIAPLDCDARIKRLESAKKKIENKSYSEPFEEMTDLVGFRVIVYLESEIELVSRIIRNCFEVDEKNSVNKLTPSTPKEVGYRSLHIVCRLGDQRKDLHEYSGICEIPFEVQIRTTLQHTWAEIEHKQNYKSEHSLPPALQRRLNVVAGTLELLDRELSNIASESKEYNSLVKIGGNEIEEDYLTASSIFAICEDYFKDTAINVKDRDFNDYDRLILELSKMDIKTVSDLKAALKGIDAGSYPTNNGSLGIMGLLRTVMAAKDVNRFYNEITSKKNIIIPPHIFDYLREMNVAGVDDVQKKQQERREKK